MMDINIESLGYKPVSRAPAQITYLGTGIRFYNQAKIAGYVDLYSKKLYFTLFFTPIFALVNILFNNTIIKNTF